MRRMLRAFSIDRIFMTDGTIISLKAPSAAKYEAKGLELTRVLNQILYSARFTKFLSRVSVQHVVS